MTPGAAFAAVVVSHNTRELLRECLESLREEGPAETVVVDNASGDGSPEMVQAAFPGVRLLANAGNPGYGAAANQGIAACRAPYILLLNGDTRPRPGTLAVLGRELERYPRAAVIGPLLLHPDGTRQPSCFPFLGPFEVLVMNTYLNRLDGRFLMPAPADGYAHLIVLGGPPGIAEAARAAGIARRVSDTLPVEESADALFVLAGAVSDPEAAARCLGPGGCAWIEPESSRWRPRGGRLRATGVYAVLPDFGRHEAYVPLDPPGALRWYAETLQPAWTAGKALRRALWSALSTRRLALTAVVGPEDEGTILDHPALPSPLRGMRPLLLAHGPDRVVLLPFSPGGSSPEAALKIPRLPRAGDRRRAAETAQLPRTTRRLQRRRGDFSGGRGDLPGRWSVSSDGARPFQARRDGWKAFSGGPEGRRHVAWGASPRKARS